MMHGLRLANISINRKMLSEMAINDFGNFQKLVDNAKKQIQK
jgi:large subunit ribosomal protein L20